MICQKKRAPPGPRKTLQKALEKQHFAQRAACQKKRILMVSQNLSKTFGKTTFSGRGQGQKSVGDTWATTGSMSKTYGNRWKPLSSQWPAVRIPIGR